MRFAKRRDPSCRRTIKPDTTIIFDTATGNWRERLKALKAAQQSESSRDGLPSKQERQ
jgi:hypothetical protein